MAPMGAVQPEKTPHSQARLAGKPSARRAVATTSPSGRFWSRVVPVTMKAELISRDTPEGRVLPAATAP